MPRVLIHNAHLFYSFDEKKDAPVLLFSNSLGTDHSMWNEQMLALKKNYSILRYDTRGHGQSEATIGSYAIELLANDVLGLMDYLGIEKVIFCGLSMGGLIGQWLGIHAPHRLYQLIICNSAAKIGDTEGWNERINEALDLGLEPLAIEAVHRWFTRTFQLNHASEVNKIVEKFQQGSLAGYAFCCCAIRDTDFSEELHKIAVPTLVIAGSEDAVTTIEEGQFQVNNIPDAQFVILPAAHLSNIEAAEPFIKAITDFMEQKSQYKNHTGRKEYQQIKNYTNEQR